MDVLLHQTFTQPASSRHCYSNMNSRMDETDPDPAHTFSHSITELPIKEGRQTKPGFTNAHPQTSGVSSGTAEPKLCGGRESSPPRTRVQRSAGSKSPYPRVKQPSELISREKVPAMRKGLVGGGTGSSKADSHNVATDSVANESNPDSVKEEASEEVGVLISAEVRSRALNSKAFEEGSDVAIVNEDNMELNSRIGVCGMEVMSNSSGTTVVLKHILPLSENTEDQETTSSSLPLNFTSNMTIVEEDKREESEDTDSPSSELSSTYILPYLIPRLYVTDEDDGFIEIVVDKARKLDSHVASDSDVHRQEVA